MKRLFLLGFLLVGFDMLTKALMTGKSFNVIDGFFRLHYSMNTGAAFGLFRGSAPILASIGIIAVLGIGWMYLHEKKQIVKYGYLLIISGCIGNLIDRLFLGYVRDFINFAFWYNFNMADAFITAGAILLLVNELFLERKKKAMVKAGKRTIKGRK